MPNNSYELLKSMEHIQNILMQISIPYIIIVSIIGIPGNVLTIIMLSKRSLTKNFNNCTLIALALTDLLFNLTLVSRCIIDLTVTISNNFCQVLGFLSHLAELLSACFTVHFTVQRFIAVRFPLSVFIEKNIHLLHYCIVILFIIFGVSYCFALIKKNDYENCQEELHLNWFLSDALLSFVLPFTIIAILNLLIICHLRQTFRDNKQFSFKKRRKSENLPLNERKKFSFSYDSNSHSRLSVTSFGPTIKSSIYQFQTNAETNDNLLSVGGVTRYRTPSIRSTTRYHAQSHRVTRMLIIVSTCFLLLNAPAHIFSISLKLYTIQKSQLMNNYNSIHINLLNTSNETTFEYSNLFYSTSLPTISKEYSSKTNVKFFQIFYIIVIISQHIAFLSYSINFFLYSFCGMKFRGELMRVISRYRKYQIRKQTLRNRTRQNSIEK